MPKQNIVKSPVPVQNITMSNTSKQETAKIPSDPSNVYNYEPSQLPLLQNMSKSALPKQNSSVPNPSKQETAKIPSEPSQLPLLQNMSKSALPKQNSSAPNPSKQETAKIPFDPSTVYNSEPSKLRENFTTLFVHSGVNPGTKEQLREFWDKYRNHETMMVKSSLDDRYFWQVLFPFQGLVLQPLHLDIKEYINPRAMTSNSFMSKLYSKEHIVLKISSKIGFNPESLKWADGLIRLINVTIRIFDSDDILLSSRNNLICIDISKQTIERFEPLYVETYTDRIDDILKTFFIGGKSFIMPAVTPNTIKDDMVTVDGRALKEKEVEIDGILPGYTYEMLDCHPQQPENKSLSTRGMSSAFVLKKAMSILVGNKCPYSKDSVAENFKILRFAHAITQEYGIMPK